MSVLITGRSTAERSSVAALLASAERAAAERWLASLAEQERVQGPSIAPTSELVSADVRTTSIADGSRGEVGTIVTEAEEADVVLLLTGRSGVSEQDRAILSAVSQHFNRHPSLLAPVLIPLVIEAGAAISADDGVMTAISACYGGIVAPAVYAGNLDTGNGGDDIWAALGRVLPRARRVATLRRIDRLKRRTRWRDAGWQATTAAGALARALWKRRDKGI